MKVLLLNGSRREKGCTYTALSIIADKLKTYDIDSEIVHVGNGEIYKGDINKVVDEVGAKMKDSDALIVGSPVYYASPTGEVLSVLDRLFSKYRDDLAYKPAASVVSARRAGTTSSFDVLNKYFTISEMPVVSSKYWNMVHGLVADDVRKDLEGVQIMEVLARNMAWILKSIEAGKKAGVGQPKAVDSVSTNFIR